MLHFGLEVGRCLLQDIRIFSKPDHHSGVFEETVSHLIRKGVMVVFDEFHHAGDLGMVGAVQIIRDRLHFDSNESPMVGRLVLMGSHQQRINRFFQIDAPLYGRAHRTVIVKPWTPAQVLEIAVHQGLLSRPGRLLSLWTAYGGMPKLWEEFARDGGRVHAFRNDLDDRVWLERFLADERRLLEANADRMFNHKARTLIADIVREPLLAMVRRPKRGVEFDDLAKLAPGREEEQWDELEDLERQLDFVELKEPFLGEGVEQSPWRINDSTSLFQLLVFRDLFKRKDSKA